MSSNIQGWRIDLPFDEAYRRLVDEVKPLVEKEGTRGINAAHALLVANEFDEIGAGIREARKGEATASDLATRTYRSVCDRQREIVRSGYRDHDVDHDFEIMLYPHEGQTFTIPICEQDHLRRMLADLDWIEDHSWWNGSDRPKTVTAAEWRRREKLWMHLVPHTLDNRGLKLSLFDGRLALRCDDGLMWKSMPTNEARLKTLGENIHVTRNYDRSRGVSQVFELLSAYRGDETIRRAMEDEIGPAIVPIKPDAQLVKRI